MIQRFSAKEARVKADNALKIIKAEKKEEQKIKREIAKKKAYVHSKFAEQRIYLIESAIEGKFKVKVDLIYCYHELLNLGFEICELGMVKSQKHSKISAKRMVQAKENIYKELDRFSEDSKILARKYYGNLSELHSKQREALDEVINSKWKFRKFLGDEIFIEEVPHVIREQYSDNLKSINSRLDFYRSLQDMYEKQEDFNFELNDEKLINGKYYYSTNDHEVDILDLSLTGNKFTISWQFESSDLYMNGPLFSRNGLSWLAGANGQSLIGEIFRLLNDATENGKKSVKIEFVLSESGWDLEGELFKFPSCSPDEIAELIEIHDFIILDTYSNKKSYGIKVAW